LAYYYYYYYYTYLPYHYSASVVAVTRFATKTSHIAAMILCVGMAASALILGTGIRDAKQFQQQQFQHLSTELVNQFEISLERYMTAGLWVHQACQQMMLLPADTNGNSNNSNTTRRRPRQQDFRMVYEYINAADLGVHAIAYIQNVTTQEQREQLEQQTRDYLRMQYPDIVDNYQGLIAYHDDVGAYLPVRQDAEEGEHMVVQFAEPMEDPFVAASLGYDFASEPIFTQAIQEALQSHRPAMSGRVNIPPPSASYIENSQEHMHEHGGSNSYSTILFHPGISLSEITGKELVNQPAKDLAAIVVRMADVFDSTRQGFSMEDHISLYVYDSTEGINNNDNKGAKFLGGAQFHSDDHLSNEGHQVNHLEETELDDIKAGSNRFTYQRRVPIVSSREWTFVVVGSKDTYADNYTFIALSGTMIFVASVCAAFWLITNDRKIANINRIKAHAETEKANIRVEHAVAATKRERELNGFLSHEGTTRTNISLLFIYAHACLACIEKSAPSQSNSNLAFCSVIPKIYSPQPHLCCHFCLQLCSNRDSRLYQ